MSWFDTILYPLMWVVAWIMYGFHWVLTRVGLESDSGVTWALSIIGLVITIRILLIPLFVRQIKAARGMQMLSPELQALQKKYKGKTDPASREAMTRETMELYRKHGTNPFSSCLPLLAQSPIFLALFRVLSNLRALAEGTFQGGERTNIGPITQQVAEEANRATIFDAEISSWFLMENATMATKVVAVALIILMSVTTFTTQKQLTQKNMPASALQGPMAQQQKMLLYILPLVFALSGVSFPIGVLIYWSTTNLWSMGQQFYVIRRNPTPGSEAERLLKERRARKAAAKGIVLEDEPTEIEPEKPKGQRQQPVRKDRARPRPTGAAGTGGSATRPAGAPSPKAGQGKPTAAGKTTPNASAGAGKGAPGKPAATGKGAPSKPAAAGKGSTGGVPASPGKSGGTTAGAKSDGTGRPARPASSATAGGSGKRRPGGATGGSQAPRKAAPTGTPRPTSPTETNAAPPAAGDTGATSPQDEQ